MTNLNLTVADAMTKLPHAIAPLESLAAARDRMLKLKVRHLPVRDGGKIVGIISDRDVDLIMNSRDYYPGKVLIKDVMIPDPYCVQPYTALAKVAAEMATRKIGSALVIDDKQQLLGIFTGTDALRFLAHILDKKSKHRRARRQSALHLIRNPHQGVSVL